MMWVFGIGSAVAGLAVLAVVAVRAAAAARACAAELERMRNRLLRGRGTNYPVSAYDREKARSKPKEVTCPRSVPWNGF